MPGKKTDKHRYWLTFLLPDLPTAAVFKPGALHITVIPWFVVEMDEAELLESFSKTFGQLQAFDVRVGETAMLGPDRDVSVNLIEEVPGIMQLHGLALDWMRQLRARWAVKQPHVGSEYIPHVRRRLGLSIAQGARLRLDHLTLVEALRAEDGQRRVAGKVTFE